MLRLIIQISKGLLREQRVRRTMMFYVTIIALVLLFLGSTALDRWLREHPLVLLLWWFACAWMTVLAMLLAVFDLLLSRAAERRALRELDREYLAKTKIDEPDDPHAPRS